MRIEALLESELSKIFTEVFETQAPAIVRPTSDPKHGDYQVNGVLPLAKRLSANPRDLATKLSSRLQGGQMFSEVSVAGPGFVNLRLSPPWVEATLNDLGDGTKIPAAVPKKKVVVDFSSPNIAKEMHVGHIRSTILGDALCRLMRAIGHDVVGDNHLGDWGTQFGLLIAGMKAFGSKEALEERAIEELERIYKAASARAKEDAAFADEARRELAALQAGNAESLATWQMFVKTTRKSLDDAYARLGVTFDTWRGESAYNDALPGVVAALLEKKLAKESEGAICVFFAELEDAPKELKSVKEPFIVQKRDGAFLYSTTDIATAEYRKNVLHADECAYVVDARQGHHFKQLFALLRLLGIDLRCDHVSFGSIMGQDGKPLKTRDGGTVKLTSVLDEAEERARVRILEEGLEVPADELAGVARKVGIGAVKYADLRQNRTTDYVFDWDKLISFKGNAGPYLQYAYARVASVFRKGELDIQTSLDAKFCLAEPEELVLGKTLLRFAEVVHVAAETRQPHLLCDHLYALAREFSGFYEACSILKSEGTVRQSRLRLAGMVGNQLRTGLSLLGIETVDRM